LPHAIDGLPHSFRFGSTVGRQIRLRCYTTARPANNGGGGAAAVEDTGVEGGLDGAQAGDFQAGAKAAAGRTAPCVLPAGVACPLRGSVRGYEIFTRVQIYNN